MSCSSCQHLWLMDLALSLLIPLRSFHFRTEGGAAKGTSEHAFPTPAESKTSIPPSSPSAASAILATASAAEGPAACPASVPSGPTLLAWKQLASTMSQLPVSGPGLATSPMATTSLENAKPQVKPGFLQFQEK